MFIDINRGGDKVKILKNVRILLYLRQENRSNNLISRGGMWIRNQVKRE